MIGVHLRLEIKLTSDQIHRDKHRTQSRQFGKDIVDLVISVRHLNRYLSEVVGV